MHFAPPPCPNKYLDPSSWIYTFNVYLNLLNSRTIVNTIQVSVRNDFKNFKNSGFLTAHFFCFYSAIAKHKKNFLSDIGVCTLCTGSLFSLYLRHSKRAPYPASLWNNLFLLFFFISRKTFNFFIVSLWVLGVPINKQITKEDLHGHP